MTTPFSYRHLYYFWVVAKEGGMSRAADKLDMAVQTVSAQVRELERSLGYALLKPAGRGLVLTDAGLAALQEREYVEKGRQVIFQELAYLKEELTALGYPVYPSQANYVFFTGPADLYEKLEQKKILIRDCSNYTGLSKGYYRVAVKKHEENQQLVRALKEIDRTKVENVIL